MLKVNDVLVIGAFSYKVRKVQGKFTLFSWISKDGIAKETWIQVTKLPAVTKAAA